MTELRKRPPEPVTFGVGGNESDDRASLVYGHGVDIERMLVRRDAEVMNNQHAGEVVVICISGRVDVTLESESTPLAAGALLHLVGFAPILIRGVAELSTLLMVQTKPPAKRALATDEVDEAAVESFPASDPPAFTSTSSLGDPAR